MAEHGKLLLNKVIEENDIKAFSRHNILETDMHNKADLDTYNFIMEYAKHNGGESPSYASVATEVAEFEYIPEISDSFKWLSTQIKERSTQLGILEWFKSGDFERGLQDLGGKKFLEEWLPQAMTDLKVQTDLRESVGTDAVVDIEKFLSEYARRKEGESFRVWLSKFRSIGEYVSSNLYTVFGKSGRGKSIVTLEEALYAASQGANVLIWAMEMGWYEVLVRVYVSLSAEAGVTRAQLHGMDLSAGFSSRDVQLGQLGEEFEETFQQFVRTLNDHVSGSITIRAVDDEDFIDRSIRALEADIESTNADFVLVDPFYYLDYETNTSRTAGGDAANTSMKLRALAGRTATVIVAVTQADETSEEEDEDGTRELALPNREDVKKTKQLLEDAYMLIGVDTDYQEGRGLVGVSKGRSGGEGNETEILFMPQVGVVREMETGEAVISEFNFI